MVSIKDRKILRQMFSHYDYVMTTAQLSKEKLYYRDIQRMLGVGLIEKVKRGYYHWTMGSGKGDGDNQPFIPRWYSMYGNSFILLWVQR